MGDVPFWAPPTPAGVSGVEAPLTPATPLPFVAITPCRLVDTRGPVGPFGGPGLFANIVRTFAFPAHPTCTGIPANAVGSSGTVDNAFRGSYPSTADASSTTSPNPRYWTVRFARADAANEGWALCVP